MSPGDHRIRGLWGAAPYGSIGRAKQLPLGVGQWQWHRTTFMVRGEAGFDDRHRGKRFDAACRHRSLVLQGIAQAGVIATLVAWSDGQAVLHAVGVDVQQRVRIFAPAV